MRVSSKQWHRHENKNETFRYNIIYFGNFGYKKNLDIKISVTFEI